jgi:hypothetical protein
MGNRGEVESHLVNRIPIQETYLLPRMSKEGIYGRIAGLIPIPQTMMSKFAGKRRRSTVQTLFILSDPLDRQPACWKAQAKRILNFGKRCSKVLLGK